MIAISFVSFAVIFIIYIILWIVALVNVLESRNEESWKTNWLIMLIFCQLIGLILWWVVGLRQRR